jgi:hypothetical protein
VLAPIIKNILEHSDVWHINYSVNKLKYPFIKSTTNTSGIDIIDEVVAFKVTMTQ